MRWIVAFFIFFAWFGTPVFSQIVINQSDMPKVGDTLRVSSTNVAPAGYAKTAMDTAWNFAALLALSQQIDTFMSATATPTSYQLFFVILGGANLASPRSGSPIPGLPVTQGFTFYKNSSTSFSELGSAYTVQGLPIPAKYDNPDKYYEFPMPPGHTWSSTASFSLNLPNVAYVSTQRYRTSIVDGWGTLTTPYGTFPTVRVKSTLLEHDSVYIDSLSTGFPFNRNIIEYKWLGKGQSIPLLQVNEEGSLVTSTYRDICRMSAKPLSITLGHDTAVFLGTTITLHALISGGTPPYQVVWNTLDTGRNITITVQSIQTYTAIVVDALQNFASAQVIVSIRYPPGVDEYGLNQPEGYPNPTQGPVSITLPGGNVSAEIQVFTPQGRKISGSAGHPVNGVITTDLSGLPDGLYFLRVSSEDHVFTTKVQLRK